MASGDDTSGARVVHQVPIGVCGVADEDALKSCVGHFAALICWDVDERRAAKNPQVLKIRSVSVCKRDRDPIDTAVISTIVQVACG